MNRMAAGIAAALILVMTANVAVAVQEIRGVVRPAWNEDRVLTILILGSDLGLPRSGNPLTGRADAIHLLAVDTRRLRATIVNIPRDSYIAGDKVNAHMTFGGPDRMKTVMSSYTGIDIDYYAVTTFRGLRTMVNHIGRVPIRLDVPVRDPNVLKANMSAGRNRLTGQQALALARVRKTIPGGDFRRSNHQGQLLRAAHAELRRSKSDLLSMTQMLAGFSRNVHTDIPATQLPRLAALALKIKPGNVRQIPLSGSAGSAGGASIVNLAPGSTFRDIKRGRIGR